MEFKTESKKEVIKDNTKSKLPVTEESMEELDNSIENDLKSFQDLLVSLEKKSQDHDQDLTKNASLRETIEYLEKKVEFLIHTCEVMKKMEQYGISIHQVENYHGIAEPVNQLRKNEL